MQGSGVFTHPLATKIFYRFREAKKYLHASGAVLMGGGLIGVWLSDLRSGQHRDLIRFSEAIRNIVVFYDGVVVPGALILRFAATWFTVQYFGG